jgi:hypothetical protein
MQQTAQPDDFDGKFAGDQRGLDLREVAGAAAQYGDVAGRCPGADEVGEGVGEPVDLLVVSGQQRAADDALVFGAGRGPERLDAFVTGAERRGESVGEGEEPAAAAAVLAEGLAAGGDAVGVGEVAGEVVEVGDGGAAPAVDGLAGVADGGDGVAGAAAVSPAPEQPGEEDALGDGGVLVLVQEDGGELAAQRLPHLGDVAGEAGGQGDLVAEVEQVPFAFAGAVLLDETEEFEPSAGGLRHGTQGGVGQPGVFELAEQLFVVRTEPRRIDEVFAEFGVEGEEVLDERGDGFRQRLERAGGGAQDARGELEAGRVGEEPGAGFDAETEAVFAQQPAGEGVVGGDLRFARGPFDGLGGGGTGAGRGDGIGVGDARADEGGADAFGEFGRGLVGERQPEDLFGRQLPGADQPHHACRHHRRLARAGARDDHLRGGRRGDARQLLRGERDAEQLYELFGAGDSGRHLRDANGFR